MQIDRQPFPMNTLDMSGKKVFVLPETPDTSKGKAVIIGSSRIIDKNTKVLAREVIK